MLMPHGLMLRSEGRAADPAVAMRKQDAAVISIKGLSKTYATGVEALKPVDLEIDKGEIFALLGPTAPARPR
jgi:ABC-type uncharacterized transport system ATPase subunit